MKVKAKVKAKAKVKMVKEKRTKLLRPSVKPLKRRVAAERFGDEWK